MEQILADLFPDTEIPYPVIAARLTGAIVLGALIGFEREYRDHPAGLRTHILVSLSAAVFSIISVESVHLAAFSGDQVRIDPLRVVEAVTSGVAFLAAGMIVFSQGQVKNLTTGAGMWLSGAVGLAVGLGYWLIAFFAGIACVLVLNGLGRLQAALQDDKQADDRKPHPSPERPRA
ncbi:MgtC/SapB family protein [Sinorhizobium sp. BG8]|uniref:MgtC/SapB family protein n=1 Tax=Sinorhizobium sp. BG8 TaxID=2613773 RepID=UPI00193D0AFD|nr:MgtC/SapB family protein [Sinorhizobium sp. BG8]QRM54608.1 MgtC/SapB family protein [Sinorhizobium sp. BG8]